MSKEKQKSIIFVVCAILVAALVIGLNVYTRMGDNGNLLRAKTAAESENFEVSGTMMTYFYHSNYSSYVSILSYLGVDTSVSLKAQSCSYIENGTWFDYFVSVTESYVTELLAICEAAKAAGYSLADVNQADIDASIDSLKATAEAYGYSVDNYLKISMGAGVNEKDVRACLELTALASLYSNKFTEGLTYTAEEKEKYYTQHSADFNGVDYLFYTVNASDFMTKDAAGNPIGDTTGASASAKAEAEKIAAASSADEFKTLVRDYITANTTVEDVDAAVAACEQTHVVAASIATVSDWAFSAKVGDTHMTGVDGDTTFTVYYLTGESYRDESVTRNVRHILLSNELYQDSAKAEEVFAEWEAAGFTDEKFAELVTAYSYDTGSLTTAGVYENVAHGEMTNHFNAWLFDDARKVNDRDIIESDYGWHIMEYLGEGEGTAWEAHAVNAMQSEDFEAMVAVNSTGITYNYEVIYEINA